MEKPKARHQPATPTLAWSVSIEEWSLSLEINTIENDIFIVKYVTFVVKLMIGPPTGNMSHSRELGSKMNDSNDSRHDDAAYSQKSLQFEQLAKEVRQISYSFSKLLSTEGVFQDLGRWGAVILGILCREEPSSIPALQAVLPLSRQYVQKEVHKLSQLGLIESIENPAHKSSKLLKPTDQGQEEYDARRQLAMSSYASIEDQFTPQELSESLRLIKKMESAIRSR